MKKLQFYFLIIILTLINTPSWAQLFPQKAAPILQQPSSIRIQRLYNLNSSYEELNLNISPDGKYLYFMSRRGGKVWSKIDTFGKSGRREYDGDIWYSTKTNGQWGSPKCLGSSVNTSDGEDEPNISPDGQRVYFQTWVNFFRPGSGGPYYTASLNGIYWGKKKPLGGGIYRFFKDQFAKPGVSTYGTDGMTVSPDGKTIIMACGGGTKSIMSLYISKKNSSGYWSYPKKLNISTSGDDRSPFLAADGKTLYFSSTGYKGKGGLDVFKCVLNSNGTASNVVNIGAPFNTSQNDYSFILTGDGREAYFSRNGDIHYADISKSPKTMKPQATLIFSGVITDKKTKKPLRAKVYFKNSKGQVVGSTFSNSATGEYSVVINRVEKRFYQTVSKPTYKVFQKTLNITYNGVGKNVVYLNAALEPPQSANQVAIAKKKAIDEARKKQEQINRQKQAQIKIAQQKKKEEARKKQEAADARKLEALKEKIQQQPAKASVYKDFS